MQVADLLLVPKCSSPPCLMPEQHTTMSEGKDMILGLTLEDLPSAWKSLETASGLNVKKFEGGSDSLFKALAHQVLFSRVFAQMWAA